MAGNAEVFGAPQSMSMMTTVSPAVCKQADVTSLRREGGRMNAAHILASVRAAATFATPVAKPLSLSRSLSPAWPCLGWAWLLRGEESFVPPLS